MIVAALAFVRRVPAMLSPTAWLAVAVMIAFLTFGGFCAHRAAQGERNRQAAAEAKIQRKAATARETASTERLNDTLTIQDRQQERDNAAEAQPDSVPDDRELRRRCRQLRDAGRSLSACRGFDGPG